MTYMEDNPETDGGNIPSTWSVAGADGGKFNISNEPDGTRGELKFKVEARLRDA